MAWTAGARTIDTLVGNGWFSFVVKAPAGAVVGLNYGVDASVYPIDIKYGLRVAGDSVEPVRKDISAGAAVTSPTREIECFVGLVRGNVFCTIGVNGSGATVALPDGSVVPGTTIVDWSPAGDLTGQELFLDASLFAAGDAVYDVYVELADYATGTAASLPLAATGMEPGVSSGIATLTIDAAGETVSQDTGLAESAPLGATGIHPGVSVGMAVSAPMTAAGYSTSFIPQVSGASISLEPMEAAGSSLTSSPSSATASIMLAARGGNVVVLEGSAVFEPMTAVGYGTSMAATGAVFNVVLPALIGSIPVDVDDEAAALALDSTFTSWYMRMVETAAATDARTTSAVTVATLYDTGTSTDFLRVSSTSDLSYSATATDESTISHSMLVVEEATASDEQFPDTNDVISELATADDGLYGSSTTTLDTDELAGAADDMLVTSQVYTEDVAYATDYLSSTVTTDLLEAATASDELTTGIDPIVDMLDTATADDHMDVQVVGGAVYMDVAWARDAVTALIRDATAWVLNTEATAAGWYTNWPFVGMAQVGGVMYAHGPAGLYVIGGDSDAGAPIKSTVEFDYLDMGGFDKDRDPTPRPEVKRLSAVYVGATGGDMELDVSAHSSDTTYTYTSQRPRSSDPTNNRFTPGKGLFGRYLKLTLANKAGATVNITDLSVDTHNNVRRL